MKKEVIDNRCMHCKYGIQEYIRLSRTFMPIKCVDCTCPIVTAREGKKRIKNKVKCNYFEYDEIENNPMRNLIEYRLAKMAKEIEEIAKVLQRMDGKDN